MNSIESELPVNPKRSEPLLAQLKHEKSRLEDAKEDSLHLIKLTAGGTLVAGAISLGLHTADHAAGLDNIYSVITLGGGIKAGDISRGYFSRRNELKSIEQSISDSYFFDEKQNLGELLENSQEMDFQDFYFETDDTQKLYEFGENPGLGFYDSLLSEPEEIEQMLTVKEEEEGHQYLLDIGIDGELAGRFTGYTEENIDHLLEESTPGTEF